MEELKKLSGAGRTNLSGFMLIDLWVLKNLCILGKSYVMMVCNPFNVLLDLTS